MDKSESPKNYFLFDVVQFPEYGGKTYQGEGFSYRYVESKKFFYRSIYIPYGPLCENKEGFDKFLNHINDLKFTKLKIDLPLILDKGIESHVVTSLQKLGFTKSMNYFQDDETFFVSKETFHLKSKYMRYVRRALEEYNIEVKADISDKELNDIYNIYLESSGRIGFKPKSQSVFKKLSENAIFSLAFNKANNELEGYVLGYITEFPSHGFDNKKDILKVFQIIFTGTKTVARKSQLGYPMHNELFTKIFDEYQMDYIDFHGASRSQGKSYIEFKESFGGQYVLLPGSFERRRFF